MAPKRGQKRKPDSNDSSVMVIQFKDCWFRNPEAKRLFLEVIRFKDLIPERGLEIRPDSDFSKPVTAHEWTKFCTTPPPGKLTVVREFYSNLKGLEGNVVPVREKMVCFSPEKINEYFGTKNYMGNHEYHKWKRLGLDLKELASELCRDEEIVWKLDSKGNPLSFPTNALKMDNYVWFQFINARLLPSSHITTINRDRIFLLYAIVNKIPIDIGRVIYNQIHLCAQSNRTDGCLLFPHLITALCAAQGVHYEMLEEEIQPNSLASRNEFRSVCRPSAFRGPRGHLVQYATTKSTPASVAASSLVSQSDSNIALAGFIHQSMHWLSSKKGWDDSDIPPIPDILRLPPPPPDDSSDTSSTV